MPCNSCKAAKLQAVYSPIRHDCIKGHFGKSFSISQKQSPWPPLQCAMLQTRACASPCATQPLEAWQGACLSAVIQKEADSSLMQWAGMPMQRLYWELLTSSSWQSVQECTGALPPQTLPCPMVGKQSDQQHWTILIPTTVSTTGLML